VVPALPPGSGDHGVALAPGLVERGERLVGLVDVRGAVDRLERRGDLLVVAVGDVAQAGADLVDDAGLHPRLREDGGNRFGKPGEPIDARD
jgi:hypothetical protein